MDPPGECESTFSFLKRLAGALDRPEVIPWDSIEDLYDWRLKKTGMSFSEFANTHEVYFNKPEYKKYLRTGFATPSGKVELSSSVLEGLGFDPLPYFRQDPPAPEGFDLKLFTGVREDGFFQTGHRHIPEMREKNPEPVCFLSPMTARAQGLSDGDWIRLETETGKMTAQVGVRDSMPNGLVRVPHGWWKPEAARGLEAGLSAAFEHSDAQLTGDTADYFDQEQGIPHFKGVPCRLEKAEAR